MLPCFKVQRKETLHAFKHTHNIPATRIFTRTTQPKKKEKKFVRNYPSENKIQMNKKKTSKWTNSKTEKKEEKFDVREERRLRKMFIY